VSSSSVRSISGPDRAAHGIKPLPLLTTVNFFNYLDRQVVYSMTPFIAESFGISKFRLGLLTFVNLVVFAIASLVSGPVADRFGPRKIIFGGVVIWAIATIGSALATSFPMLLFFRALVGVGEGAYGPSAIMLLCAAAEPQKQGRSLGIYNAGMALGGSTGLFLGAVLAPEIGWRGVFWIAGAPSLLLALLTLFVAAPSRLPRPHTQPARTYLLNPTFLLCTLGGILVTFSGAGLLFWARWLIIDERGFSVWGGSILMLCLGLGCGIGGVLTGGYLGDWLGKRRVGGHAMVVGLSLLVAIPVGIGCLTVEHKFAFALLTGGIVFLLSMYNGPAAVVVDQLAPPQYAATLQSVFLFSVHVLGDAPAASVVGYISGFTSIANALMVTVLAFALSGLLFVWVAQRQRATVLGTTAPEASAAISSGEDSSPSWA
jgi:MFS transporter, Spinster family, sphingosine-1-phosphate transporter